MGVRKTDNILNREKTDVIYRYYKKKGGVGVGTDKIVYLESEICPKNTSLLLYNKPCLCGSLSHRNIRHHKCCLNVRYMDAVEK